LIVVDTKVILYLLIEGEATQAAQTAMRADPEWVAPAIWRIECINVLSTYCRLGKLSLQQVQDAYRRACLIVHDPPRDVDPKLVLELSVGSGVSGYDCIFVGAAQLNDLPLVTFGRRLWSAFPETAINPDGIGPWFERRSQRRQQNENHGS